MTLVSVVIPTHNRAGCLERAVQSVVAQTHRDLEVIVVDDGSQDDSARVVKEYARNDARVRLIEHGEKKGAQAARNTGIRASRGEWIAFLDSDDEWLPHSLETRLEVARREKVFVVHSGCLILEKDGKSKQFPVPPMSGSIYREVLVKPGPMFQGLLVVKDAWKEIGYLDELIVSYQEWDTAIRLAKHYAFAFVPEPTFIYDCRGMETISKNPLREGRGYEQVFRKHWLAILRHAGPRVLARHYRIAAWRYEMAGAASDYRRCMMMANLCSPRRAEIIRGFRKLLHI